MSAAAAESSLDARSPAAAEAEAPEGQVPIKHRGWRWVPWMEDLEGRDWDQVQRLFSRVVTTARQIDRPTRERPVLSVGVLLVPPPDAWFTGSATQVASAHLRCPDRVLWGGFRGNGVVPWCPLRPLGSYLILWLQTHTVLSRCSNSVSRSW